jgi:hypothetical protein
LDANKYRLGSVVESTPAVLAPPVRPYYYNLADLSTRTAIDSFIDRVMVGDTCGYLYKINPAGE